MNLILFDLIHAICDSAIFLPSQIYSQLLTLKCLSDQPAQAKKFEISKASEGSPATLVHFVETIVMDTGAEEEEIGEEDTLESFQPPFTPTTHSGAQAPPLLPAKLKFQFSLHQIVYISCIYAFLHQSFSCS